MGLALDGNTRFDWIVGDPFRNCWRDHINCDFWFGHYADERTCDLTGLAATNTIEDRRHHDPPALRHRPIIDAAMARITAERLIHHLERAGLC
jgi:hypothetical protein